MDIYGHPSGWKTAEKLQFWPNFEVWVSVPHPFTIRAKFGML